MTIPSRLFLNLMQQYKCQPSFLHRGFSKPSLINDQKIQKTKEKNAKGTTKREKNQDKNMQKDGKTDIKVCIIGGGVTPLYTAILLKQYRIIKSINLVDTKDSMSEAMMDTCHAETNPCINHFRKKDIKQALKEANIVALMDETDVAAMDSMTPQAQFKSAADYVRRMTDQILRFCPDALVAVFARPVTATLAMVSEIFRCSGWWNPDRIVGSTATHGAQIERMARVLLNLEDAGLSVPLAGGADVRTIVPLFSRAIPFNQFTNAQRKILLQTFRVGDEATKSLNEGPSLSFGTAAAKLITTLGNGLCGFDHVTTCAYVRSNVLPVCRFFTSELQLGPEGIERNLGLPKITPMEILLIEQVIPHINEYIDMAIAAVRTERMRVKTR
ncbi:malate dehydrogenase, mitochondrial-like [Linepithema humile]|uniref:malate dehydrogenase, mitochondrial-like n=1 Tax=Linepithema humile TaxID=83485 RepID=UPI00062395C5|nr:PREDICTED: malate dehydrogenase, mitochondrial-like [Linepithema humile]